MFSWLFGKKPPDDPPTEKQRRYAKVLSIEVTPDMTKADLSYEIAKAEKRSPKHAKQRAEYKRNQRIREFGREAVEKEEEWNEFADEQDYMLAIYQRGKDIIVDVLRVLGADINKRKKVVLDVQAPKVVKDPDIGRVIEWEREFTLPLEKLLYFEGLGRDYFLPDDLEKYKKLVERGLKIAKKF